MGGRDGNRIEVGSVRRHVFDVDGASSQAQAAEVSEFASARFGGGWKDTGRKSRREAAWKPCGTAAFRALRNEVMPSTARGIAAGTCVILGAAGSAVTTGCGRSYRKRARCRVAPGQAEAPRAAPCAGMIHQDGSTHEWTPGVKWDLIVGRCHQRALLDVLLRRAVEQFPGHA